jgi:hypothetical protein
MTTTFEHAWIFPRHDPSPPCFFPVAMSNLQSVSDAGIDSEHDLPNYRPVSSLAVIGLLCGFASVLAYSHRALWLVPWVAVGVNWAALRRIAFESGQMIGRRSALIGLVLGLICGIGAPLQYIAFGHLLRSEAIEITEQWLEALRNDQPEVAHQLTMAPLSRFPLDDQLIQRYPPELLGVMQKFAERPTVELLLKLGKRARVRYYSNDQVWSDHFGDYVADNYAVTLGQGDRRVTFFIRITAARVYNPAAGKWQWRVSDSDFVSSPSVELLEQLAAGNPVS